MGRRAGPHNLASEMQSHVKCKQEGGERGVNGGVEDSNGGGGGRGAGGLGRSRGEGGRGGVEEGTRPSNPALLVVFSGYLN